MSGFLDQARDFQWKPFRETLSRGGSSDGMPAKVRRGRKPMLVYFVLESVTGVKAVSLTKKPTVPGCEGVFGKRCVVSCGCPFWRRHGFWRSWLRQTQNTSMHQPFLGKPPLPPPKFHHLYMTVLRAVQASGFRFKKLNTHLMIDHMAVGQNQWYRFGVGEFTTHFSRFFFCRDWDVHWGYNFDPWPNA